jgi:hypothetical protein
LEDANVRLESVASDVVGVSCRAMIERLVEGQTDPYKLADLAQQEELIAEPDSKIEEHTRPFAAEIGRLDAIPGVDTAWPRCCRQKWEPT